MNITTVGIDLAKNVFQVHGVDERGKVVLRRTVKRADLVKLFANMPACLIGLEACGSAHYWARKLGALGHTVKLMSPQFVKPYVKTDKNDASDAEAICEAVEPAEHAICAGEECGAADGAGGASGAAGICRGTHCTGESDSGSAV